MKLASRSRTKSIRAIEFLRSKQIVTQDIRPWKRAEFLKFNKIDRNLKL